MLEENPQPSLAREGHLNSPGHTVTPSKFGTHCERCGPRDWKGVNKEKICRKDKPMDLGHLMRFAPPSQGELGDNRLTRQARSRAQNPYILYSTGNFHTCQTRHQRCARVPLYNTAQKLLLCCISLVAPLVGLASQVSFKYSPDQDLSTEAGCPKGSVQTWIYFVVSTFSGALAQPQGFDFAFVGGPTISFHCTGPLHESAFGARIT